MSVALASTWMPRGETTRLLNDLSQLEEIYAAILIVLPSDIENAMIAALEGRNKISLMFTSDWSWGRYLALQKAMETSADYIHYADLDRLIRWVETCPKEWRRTVGLIQNADCTVIGRTEEAYQTHPQALRQTEKISNLVFSHLIGKSLDLSAGSKGFSRRAARFLLANSQPGRALGMDAEWLVLLHRAGFHLESILVDGLDWESADRYQFKAASREAQRRAAEAYDADPQNWARRVQVALEIIESGLDALNRPLNLKDTNSRLGLAKDRSSQSGE